MRLTINKPNQTYLKTLAQAWGLNEKEALNYLLNKLRIEGINQAPIQSVSYNDSILESKTYEETAPEEFTTDPVIERLLAAGLDLDF